MILGKITRLYLREIDKSPQKYCTGTCGINNQRVWRLPELTWAGILVEPSPGTNPVSVHKPTASCAGASPHGEQGSREVGASLASKMLR